MVVVVPQEPEGELLLQRRFRIVLLELPDLVLDVGFAASADKFQIGNRAVAGRDNDQLPVVRGTLDGVWTEIQRRQEGTTALSRPSLVSQPLWRANLVRRTA